MLTLAVFSRLNDEGNNEVLLSTLMKLILAGETSVFLDLYLMDWDVLSKKTDNTD